MGERCIARVKSHLRFLVSGVWLGPWVTEEAFELVVAFQLAVVQLLVSGVSLIVPRCILFPGSPRSYSTYK